jgi:hypothetical protein
MEMSQGYYLYSLLKKQKCHFFFSFTKSENRSADQVLPGGMVTVGTGRRWRKCMGG